MNVSKQERKALELLSLGGKISVEKGDQSQAVDASFITREGWFLDGVGLNEFQSLRAKRFVGSRKGEEYAITREGIKILQQFRQAQKVAQRNSRLAKKVGSKRTKP
ncbi:YjhX family toxin [Camelimonas sp. ID_303_24]